MSEIIFSEWFSWTVSIFILAGAGLAMALITLDARGNSPNADFDREWAGPDSGITIGEITSTTHPVSDHSNCEICKERASGVHETAD